MRRFAQLYILCVLFAFAFSCDEVCRFLCIQEEMGDTCLSKCGCPTFGSRLPQAYLDQKACNDRCPLSCEKEYQRNLNYTRDLKVIINNATLRNITGLPIIDYAQLNYIAMLNRTLCQTACSKECSQMCQLGCEVLGFGGNCSASCGVETLHLSKELATMKAPHEA